jgi:hypothetical protein
MDDVRAVMDAVGSERAALFGYFEGGPMSIFFAANGNRRRRGQQVGRRRHDFSLRSGRRQDAPQKGRQPLLKVATWP